MGQCVRRMREDLRDQLSVQFFWVAYNFTLFYYYDGDELMGTESLYWVDLCNNNEAKKTFVETFTLW